MKSKVRRNRKVSLLEDQEDGVDQDSQDECEEPEPALGGTREGEEGLEL